MKKYDNLNFNIIEKWINENSFCQENEGFITDLEFSDYKNLNRHHEYTNDLLQSLLRNDSIPKDRIVPIDSWNEQLKLANLSLNQIQLKNIYILLNLSIRVDNYLNENFNSWNKIKSDLLINKSLISNFKAVFDISFNIKDNASPELRKIISKIKNKKSQKEKIINKLFKKAQDNNLINGSNPTIRNSKIVFPVLVTYKNNIKGIVHDQSSSGNTIFIEPFDVIKIDNDIEQLYLAKEKEIKSILLEITKTLHPYYQEIFCTYNFILKFDKHHTIAKLAKHTNSIKPKINVDNKRITILNGENPILKLMDKEIIPLNLELKENKILLLSGPNAGGKTIALKTIGLFSVMTKKGLFIPATKVEIPLFQNILTDIGDNQSVTNDLSTFSAHITNIINIITNSNSESIILIDELGTGTDPDSGAALSKSVIEKIIQLNSFLIATTHLNDLKLWAQDSTKIINGSMLFNQQNLSPTYKLELGLPGTSYALEIAKRTGLSDTIINRAKELIKKQYVNFEKIIYEIESNKNLLEKNNKILKTKISTLNTNIKKFEENNDDLNIKLKNMKYLAAKNSEQIILQTRKKMEEIIANIKLNEANNKSIKEAKNTINLELEKIHTKISKNKIINKKFLKINPKKISLGDEVYILEMDKNGIVFELNNKKAIIIVNGIKLNLNYNKIYYPIHTIKNTASYESRFNITKLNNIELNIRGVRFEEAMSNLEIFIDQAVVSNIKHISVLHGKGSGILKKGVEDYLNKLKCIQSYKTPDEAFGGTGKTLIELK
tara:strand:+ start:1304 stop:3634 length:2331 start_codon:yes stop_codon:yes gene_type:complete